MKEKILVMHQSQSYAGTDVFALNIIDGLKKSGYEVEIILNDDNKDIDNFHNACKTHNYGHRLLTAYHLDSKKAFVKKLFIMISFPILILIHLIKLFKKIKEINPSKILIVNAGIPGGILVYSGAIVCGLLNINTLYTVHSDVVYNRYLKFYYYFIEYFVSKFSNIKFVSVSKYNIERILSRSFFIKDVDLVYNGIEKPINSLELNDKKTTFDIVFIGNISLQKGVKVLIEAFKLLGEDTSYRLFIYGKKVDSLFYNEIIFLIQDNSKITLILNEYNKDIIFKDKDLLILPSTSLESFGQVLIEAMSYGIPVLGSNGLGIKEVIEVDDDYRAGETFKLSDSLALKEKIEKFNNDKIIYQKYKDNTKYLYEKYFTKELMIENYIKLLEER